MKHFTLDGFGGSRSRYDDLGVVHELLADAPAALGLTPAMPPMVLPYHDGAAPDDCGISGFVILNGGHVTLHTFSYRECFFADVVAPAEFDTATVERVFRDSLPAAEVSSRTVDAEGETRADVRPDNDFGPHWMMQIEGYRGPSTLDELFAVFDTLPEKVGMTPIMRPYVLRSRSPAGASITSAVTMIAESHVAIHLFEGTRRAWFDIFSCAFFDMGRIRDLLCRTFPGDRHVLRMAVRGTRFRDRWTQREREHARGKSWLAARQTS